MKNSKKIVFLTLFVVVSVVFLALPQPVRATSNITRRFYAPFDDARTSTSGYITRASASETSGELHVYLYKSGFGAISSEAQLRIVDTAPFDCYMTVKVRYSIQCFGRAQGWFAETTSYAMWEYSSDPWAENSPRMWNYIEHYSVGDGSYFNQFYKTATATPVTASWMESHLRWIESGHVGYTVISFYAYNSNGGWVQKASGDSSNAYFEVHWIEITYVPM